MLAYVARTHCTPSHHTPQQMLQGGMYEGDSDDDDDEDEEEDETDEEVKRNTAQNAQLFEEGQKTFQAIAGATKRKVCHSSHS